MSQYSMAHIIGKAAKWAGIILVMMLAGLLSFLFFQGIAPPDQAWFPYAALSLTEGGMILWILVFRLTNYHVVEKTIAFLMSGACLIASFSAAGYEFYRWMSHQMALAQPAWIQQGIATLLEVMFFCHMAAFAIELISGGFDSMAKQGFSFRGRIVQEGNLIPARGNLIPARGNLIPAQNGNLIPTSAPAVTVKELKEQQQWITAQLEAAGAGTDPLAGRQLPRRAQSRAAALANEQQVADAPDTEEAGSIGRAVSGIASRLRNSIKRGKPGGPVPGEASAITSESTSESIIPIAAAPGEGMTDLDVWAMAYERSGAKARGEELPDFVRRMKALDEQPEDGEDEGGEDGEDEGIDG